MHTLDCCIFVTCMFKGINLLLCIKNEISLISICNNTQMMGLKCVSVCTCEKFKNKAVCKSSSKQMFVEDQTGSILNTCAEFFFSDAQNIHKITITVQKIVLATFLTIESWTTSSISERWILVSFLKTES